MRDNAPPLGVAYQNSIRRVVPIEDFHTFVRPLVGDVSTLVLDHNIAEAIRWFCDESHVLMDETVIQFQRGVRDYVLPIPAHQLLLAPELLPWWCRNRGGTYAATPADAYFGDVFGFGNTAYEVFRDGSQQVIEFAYEPQIECSRRIPYSWTLQRDFCEVPALLYDMWVLPIKFRAAADIMLMPGEQFSSTRKSEFFAEKAKKGLERARRWKAQNYSHQPRKMRVRPFLRGSFSRTRFGGGGGSFGPWSY